MILVGNRYFSIFFYLIFPFFLISFIETCWFIYISFKMTTWRENELSSKSMYVEKKKLLKKSNDDKSNIYMYIRYCNMTELTFFILHTVTYSQIYQMQQLIATTSPIHPNYNRKLVVLQLKKIIWYYKWIIRKLQWWMMMYTRFHYLLPNNFMS